MNLINRGRIFISSDGSSQAGGSDLCKLMHAEGIREFEDLYIIADLDDYEDENLKTINNKNKIVIDILMIDCNGYAGTM